MLDTLAAGADLRVASFNASMNRSAEGALIADLRAGDDQARAIAEIIQKTDADVILVNEFDYDPDGTAAETFRDDYLAVGQNGADPIDYPHIYAAPSNTGVPTGFDLDNDGGVGGPGDAQGFGFFEGQFGFVIYSKHPIAEDDIRTFQTFLWRDMPGALLPPDPEDTDGDGGTASFYTDEELAVLRLSSKNHVDVPVVVDGVTVHVLAAHPTPPVFDGPEDRNGARNHDEIRFWADYVAGADYVYDDTGRTGGLASGERFVIVGDYNADPFDGDSRDGAIDQFLVSPLIEGSATDADITPTGPGGAEQAVAQGGANADHVGNPAFDTSDFGFNPDNPAEDRTPGNLRVDYVLPGEAGLAYVDGGVFWPESTDPDFALTSFPTSDHRLVFADLALEETASVYTLELLHFADQEAGSAAVTDAPNLSAVVNALRAQDVGDDGAADNTVTLSSGDAFIPGVFFDASEALYGAPGIADIQIQNELGVQAIALGNHEFDLGTALLADLIDGSAGGDIVGADFAGTAFPYLSANLDFAPDADLAPLAVAGGQAPQGNVVTSSVVIDTNGEPVGVVGATTPTLAAISSPGDVGIAPEPFGATPSDAELDALAAEIQAEVDMLLAATPDLNKVVLLSHMQRLDIERALAERLEGVDVIVAGGSNTRLFDADDRPRDGDSVQGEYPIFVENAGGTQTAVVNTDGSYKYVGRLVIDFDADGNILPGSYDAAVSGAYATDEAGVAALGAAALVDSEVQQIADEVEAQIVATESNLFGTSTVFLNGNRSGNPGDADGVRTQETNLGNLTADANLAYAEALTGEDIEISLKNGGGIRASIGEAVVLPGDTEASRLPNPAIVDGDGTEVKPEGGISQNDIQTTLAFNNGLVVLTLTGAEVVDLLEHGVSALPEVAGQFPQIAGLRFSFDPDGSAGDRIESAGVFDEDTGALIAELVRDGAVVNADATYDVVTLDFLARPRFDEDGTFIGGGDGYPFPNTNADPAVGEIADAETLARIDPRPLVDEGTRTGDATFADDGTEQDALAEFLDDLAAPFDEADTTPVADGRIQNLSFRDDAVFGDAAPLLTESFEAEPGDTYVLTPAPFDDGSFDFFGRFAAPDLSNGARDDFLSGFDGQFAIFAQDNDGEGGPAAASIRIDGIDLTGFDAPDVTIALGALNSDQFNNYEGSDGIRVFAATDGDEEALIGAFVPIDDDGDDEQEPGGNLRQDTDLDGTADGDRLTTTLTDFTFDLPEGDLLDLRIELTSNDSFEPLVVDDVRVGDDSGADRDVGGGGGSIDEAPTLISAIQGTQDEAALLGETVVVEGIVTGDYQNGDADGFRDLGGFFLMEEDADRDGDDATSEGIFAFEGDGDTALDVEDGDRVRVLGTVVERFGKTTIQATEIRVEEADAADPLSLAVEVALPDVADREALESMLVTVAEPLTFTESFDYEDFNQATLSTDGAVYQYTQRNAPDAAGNAAYQEAVADRLIVIDDGSDGRRGDFDPIPAPDGSLVTDPTEFRMGQSVDDLTAIFDYGFGAFRLRLPEGVAFDLDEDTNPVPEAPIEVGSDYRVASFNVLNYFTTLDDGGTTAIGADPRGAESAEELARQEAKIVEAILQLDADVIGLVEIENEFAGDSFALQTLVDAINAEAGTARYAFVDPEQQFVGDDAIAVAFIYDQTTTVTVGDAAILDTPGFLDPLGDQTDGDSFNRAALAQSFQEIDTAGIFTASINHFKSKGSLTGAAADEDQGDGAGRNDATRTEAARELAGWLATDPTGAGDGDVMILGDLNAYAREAPIVALEDAGYTDLARAIEGDDAYSFRFSGQIGTLDYALANESLLSQVTGAQTVHTNADTPVIFDYNLDDTFTGPNILRPTDQGLFGETPLRASDHDPVVVGLDLDSEVIDPVVIAGTAGNDRLNGTDAEETLIAGGGRIDVLAGGGGSDVFVFTDTDDARDGLRILDYGVGEDAIDLGGAEIVDTRAVRDTLRIELADDRDAIYVRGVTDIADIDFATTADTLLA